MLKSRERRKINSRIRMYLFMKVSRVVLRGVRLREEPLTWYVIRNSLKYGRFTTLNISKCEHFTLCVSVAVSGDFWRETAKKCTKF